MFKAMVSLGVIVVTTMPSLGAPDAVERPVYPVTGDAGALEKRLEPLTAMTEEQMLALIPEVNGIQFCGCPNCSGGREESQMVWNGPSDPDRVHCGYCEMVYPNDRYPMDESLDAPDRLGVVRTWRFHKDAIGNQYYFSARARQDAKLYMGQAAYDFAAAYRLTGRRQYARRGALILARFSQVFPGYNITSDYPAPGKKFPIADARPPYNWAWGMWGRWVYSWVPVPLLRAYDLLYDSGELERISPEIKPRLESDVFHWSVAAVRSFPDDFSNAMPTVYEGAIVAGRVLGEPEYVHYAVDRIVAMFHAGFLFDGMWKEGSVSYHYYTMGNLRRAFDAVKGHSDPPGYTGGAAGGRLDDVDLEKDIPVIARANAAPLKLVYPGGRVVAVHDTWGRETYSPEAAEGPALLAAMGHGRLGCGEGPGAFQAHLHFSGSHGHAHQDNLNITLFAHGRELLSEIGYTWTSMRNVWTAATLAHNTVAIDGQDHISRDGGNLTLYSAGPGPVQAIEATQLETAADLGEFRRRLILVQVSADRAYVVDVFGVKGGRRHEYCLHGSADLPQEAETSLDLQPTWETMLGPGARFELPTSNTTPGRAPEGKLLSYALMRDLRETTTDRTFTTTWRFSDGSPVGLRTTLLGQPESRVILAQSPQVRPAQENEGELQEHRRPSLVIRREAETELESVFVAVHEPFEGEPFIRSATVLRRPERVGESLVLAVEHSGGIDTIISSPIPGGEPLRIAADTPIDAHCRLGVVRLHEGRPVFAVMVDGRRLEVGRLALRGGPGRQGRVLAVARDEVRDTYSLTVDTPLPAGEVLAGQTLLVTHGDGSTHGYPIGSVESVDGGSVVHLRDDPGFEIEGAKTRFVFFPRNEIEGANTFHIDETVLVESGSGPRGG